jgi:ribosomal protein S20
MDAQHKELEMMRKEITAEVRGIFKTNMKIFDWDIPENDDREAAELILDVMQEAIDTLRREVKGGKYDNY